MPLDFEAPLNQVWKGYINPYPGALDCEVCGHSGLNQETKSISDSFYSHFAARAWHDKITQDEVQALVDKGRLMDFTHTWTQGEGWKRREDGYIPSAEEVNAAQRRPGLHGHDALNRWILIETRAKRLGVFGKCQICKGEGWLPNPDEAAWKLHEEWKEYEPPQGPGFQLWETCSEGSPVSPVFKSAESLAAWCEENATIFADEKLHYSKWLNLIQSDTLDAGSLLVASSGYVGSLAGSGTDL